LIVGGLRPVKQKRDRFMKIGELARMMHIPASTIRYYVREGMLPPPVMAGKTVSYYSEEHIERLVYIKKKQGKGRMTLAAIKQMLDRDYAPLISPQARNGIPSDKREDIISSAIDLFFQKGYKDTSISDIVKHARMSKETVYQHFRNKEELFIECADRIFHEMYHDVWQDIRDEKDMIVRMWKRARAFVASYPKWVIMMNLVRSLSEGENPAFREKLKHVVRQIVEPIIRDMKRLHAESRIRDDIDINLAGYIAMGMAEYGAELVHQKINSEEEVLEYLEAIFQHGLKA
jgi:AcrR family transcriptional regulator/predicted DNA-binding transcriptional regulator AlpA